MKCNVMKRRCRDSTPSCDVEYSGKQHAIHQWSKDVCAGDEIGWLFVRAVETSKSSFTGFKTMRDFEYNENWTKSAPFMSVHTFLCWWFSWTAAMCIDFRKTGDPCQEKCYTKPMLVVADGTHRGCCERYMDRSKLTHIENAEIDVVEEPRHRRFDRVFMPYRRIQGKITCDNDMKINRLHLHEQCSCILEKKSAEKMNATLRATELSVQNNRLLNICRDLDSRVHKVVNKVIHELYPQRLLKTVARVLRSLCRDAPLLAFLPWDSLDTIEMRLNDIASGRQMDKNLRELATINPEFTHMLRAARAPKKLDEIIDFIKYLVEDIRRVYKDDPPAPDPVTIPGTYNPEKGLAYYFTPHGCQVRKKTGNTMDKTKGQNFDDMPDSDICTKDFPYVGRGGFGYIMVFCCADHGHVLGFHIINGSEGRKDVSNVLYKYLPVPPSHIFYDFACSVDEYGMNRFPGYFRRCHIHHDVFHSVNHTCPECYKSHRFIQLRAYNTEICEQFNSYLNVVKFTASHLTMSHYMQFMQFFTHRWNVRKTNLHSGRLIKAAWAARRPLSARRAWGARRQNLATRNL